MDFSDIRSFWSLRTGSGGTSNSASAPHGEHNFLPQTSVDISDRTRRANRLGEGSFAKVYRGEYNGKPCAVKVFKEDILKKGLTLDPGSEVKMVSRLKHKNIVQIYGMWLDPHKDRAAPSIVMELCDESLYDFSRRFKGKIVPKLKKLPLLQDIARGMVYLHGQNIVHGDLRSSNVLLCHSEDRTVAKVADFDMARFLDTGAQHHFTIRFTDDQYLPPEVFDHKEHKDHQKKVARLTPKVDVFCFGELVLEMGCGTYPTPTRKFRGQEMLTELQRRERHMLKLKQSDKESLGSIIQKCLADAPEGRPSFTEILVEVDGYLHKYGERPDLEALQDKTAECEVLRAEAVKWEDDPKSLCGMQDELEKELEKERTEKQDLQINLQMQQIKVEELQQQIQANAQQQHKKDQGAWAQAQQRLNSEIEMLKKDAESSLVVKTASESSQAKLKQENQKLQENLSAVEGSLATISAQYSNQVKELNQKQLETESLASSLKTAQEQAARDERKLELFSDVCAQLRSTEIKFLQASLDNGALKKEHQAALHMCQSEVSEVTAHANRCQEEKNKVWREKEENEVAWRKEKEELQQSHDRVLKQKERDFAKEKEELENRHAKEMASTEEGIQQIRTTLAEMDGISTQPPPSAKKGRRVQPCATTQSALQDTNHRVNNLLREKSDWMKQQREHDRIQTLLEKAKGEVTFLKDKLQICEEAKETRRKEKNDFMTRYKELLQQQKGWESAIADSDAAKKAMSQAQDEKDLLLKEHKELQDHCDKVNKRLLVVQHEKSQMAAKLQRSTLGNDAAGLISDSDYRDAEENDNAISEQEALRKQNEQLQRQQMELKALLSERIASTVAEEQKVLIARCEESITAMEGKLKQVATFFPRLKVKCDSVALQMERLKDYHELKEKTVRLQGELAEKQRASEADRNELVAAKVQRLLAEKERDEQAEKCLLACQERETVRNEAEEKEKQLKTLKEEHSTLHHKVSDLETDNASLQEKLSDIEKDKDKLQASRQHAERLEAEREEYQRKFADSNEWIMHHHCTQDKEGSPKHLLEKTEFHTMMELFKVYYEKASKRSEQTAEENQRLLASNYELKEKVQELAQASHVLQEKLSEKQKLLEEQQRETAVLREELSTLQEIEVVPSLASDIIEQTDDEVLLQRLCYMATGIKQLLITPDGGTFILGNGDASLKFPPGAVQKDIHIRYAIILYGPFVLPAGYKPGSVIVYLNMDGATLVKPIQLLLSHWCIRKETDDEETMMFVRAPHSLESGKKEYAFEEVEEEADFNTHFSMGVLTIQKPHCLYCVEVKHAKNARYCAMTFSRYVPSEDILLFRIQLMCDSLDWIKELAESLAQRGWKKSASSDIVPRFGFTAVCIAASTTVSQGPGWSAMIEGTHEVKEADFLMPKGKSKYAMKQEVCSGRYPPCICYKVVHSVPEERRMTPAILKVDLVGADVHLTFSCTFKAAEIPASPVSPVSISSATSVHLNLPHTGQRTSSAESSAPSPVSPGPIPSAETPPSSPQAKISKPADVVEALKHDLDAQWRQFGTYLRVEPVLMDSIVANNSKVEDCMLQLVEKWLGHENGTDDRPRTWETVVQAVKNTGKGHLAEELAEKHGVQLSRQ